jgi:protein disulfide-isomerase A6
MVELTDDTFVNNVLDSEDIWMVEIYVPCCGQCQNLEPEYAAAASVKRSRQREK